MSVNTVTHRVFIQRNSRSLPIPVRVVPRYLNRQRPPVQSSCCEKIGNLIVQGTQNLALGAVRTVGILVAGTIEGVGKAIQSGGHKLRKEYALEVGGVAIIAAAATAFFVRSYGLN